MINFKYIKSILAVLACSIVITGSNFYLETATAQVAVPSEVNRQYVSPIEVVNTPKSYLGKTISFKAKFDKFSTLGLDYKSAFKSSEEFITFLIKRDDTTFDIPLSEMKLFLKREEAEKFIDLKADDEIEVIGKVFSDALGDPWIEVNQLKLLKKAPDKKDGV